MKYTYNNLGYKYHYILEDTIKTILYFVIMKVHIAKNRFQNLLVFKNLLKNNLNCNA